MRPPPEKEVQQTANAKCKDPVRDVRADLCCSEACTSTAARSLEEHQLGDKSKGFEVTCESPRVVGDKVPIQVGVEKQRQ